MCLQDNLDARITWKVIQVILKTQTLPASKLSPCAGNGGKVDVRPDLQHQLFIITRSRSREKIVDAQNSVLMFNVSTVDHLDHLLDIQEDSTLCCSCMNS